MQTAGDEGKQRTDDYYMMTLDERFKQRLRQRRAEAAAATMPSSSSEKLRSKRHALLSSPSIRPRRGERIAAAIVDSSADDSGMRSKAPSTKATSKGSSKETRDSDSKKKRTKKSKRSKTSRRRKEGQESGENSLLFGDFPDYDGSPVSEASGRLLDSSMRRRHLLDDFQLDGAKSNPISSPKISPTHRRGSIGTSSITLTPSADEAGFGESSTNFFASSRSIHIGKDGNDVAIDGAAAYNENAEEGKQGGEHRSFHENLSINDYTDNEEGFGAAPYDGDEFGKTGEDFMQVLSRSAEFSQTFSSGNQKRTSMTTGATTTCSEDDEEDEDNYEYESDSGLSDDDSIVSDITMHTLQALDAPLEEVMSAYLVSTTGLSLEKATKVATKYVQGWMQAAEEKKAYKHDKRTKRQTSVRDTSSLSLSSSMNGGRGELRRHFNPKALEPLIERDGTSVSGDGEESSRVPSNVSSEDVMDDIVDWLVSG